MNFGRHRTRDGTCLESPIAVAEVDCSRKKSVGCCACWDSHQRRHAANGRPHQGIQTMFATIYSADLGSKVTTRRTHKLRTRFAMEEDGLHTLCVRNDNTYMTCRKRDGAFQHETEWRFDTAVSCTDKRNTSRSGAFWRISFS